MHVCMLCTCHPPTMHVGGWWVVSRCAHVHGQHSLPFVSSERSAASRTMRWNITRLPAACEAPHARLARLHPASECGYPTLGAFSPLALISIHMKSAARVARSGWANAGGAFHGWAMPSRHGWLLGAKHRHWGCLMVLQDLLRALLPRLLGSTRRKYTERPASWVR